MLIPVSSQLADFLRLWPTPASSGEVGCSAVNRRVASSNLARGATSCPFAFSNSPTERSLAARTEQHDAVDNVTHDVSHFGYAQRKHASTS
jgi:hypothetical protein